MTGSIKTTTVDLLRHGQLEMSGCLIGHTDVALSPEGWQQMHKTMAQPLDYDQVISSPLKRCRDFAAAFSQQYGLSMTTRAGWREISFGQWDGKAYDWLYEHHQTTLSDFWRDPWQHPLPTSEPADIFYRRVVNSWQQLVDDYRGQKILLVCHSGIIRQLIGFILGMEPAMNHAMTRLNIPHGSLSRIEIYHDEQGRPWPRLMFLNSRESSV